MTNKIKTLFLIFSIGFFLVTLYYIKTLNLIFTGLNQSKSGWNTYPPISALIDKKIQESLNLDPKLIFFEVLLFILIGYLSIDICRKIQKQ
jgi:hypothetical protein